MNTQSFKIILLIVIATLVSAGLHWLAGLGEGWLVSRFAPKLQQDGERPSLRRLLFDWICKALQTIIWISYIIFLIGLVPQSRAEIKGLSPIWQPFQKWYKASNSNFIGLVIVIVGMIFLCRFASALINLVFDLVERGAVNRHEPASLRRMQTLSTTFRGIAQTLIVFIGLLTSLETIGVKTTPILFSAGAVGIAIGLGAQSLIKDFFAGFLILLEDQFSVGDIVKIGDTSGTVELLTMRVTRIRSIDGSLTMIPNGTINSVINYSKGWSRVVLDIEIDYKEDVDRAMKVILETAKTMREERPVDIIEEPSMLGVDKVSGRSVTIRLIVKTAPNKQFEIGRELRRRVKLAFDREEIKIPSLAQQLVLSESIDSIRLKL